MSKQTKENIQQTAVDEKIRYYATRYKNGKATTEEMKTLVRLLYEEKKEGKKAVWILNQCMGKAKETSVQLLYLYEALRAMRSFENELYEKYEVALYQKVEQLAEKETVHSYADFSVLYSCMEDAVRRKDIVCYCKLEQIWKPYWENDIAWKKRFGTLKKEVQKEKVFGRFHHFLKTITEKNTTHMVELHHSKSIVICFFIACICFAFLAGMVAPSVVTYFRQQKEAAYLENHNMLLTSEELSKIEKVQEKYSKQNGTVIRYCQLAEGEDIEPLEAEKFICLFVKNYGTIVTYELQCKGLEEELRKELWNNIVAVFEGEAEDFKKCKQYFQLAYEMIEKEHGLD